MDLTDEKLYELCRKYGEISLKYRRKFVGLLPEVYKRELFKKKGFSSIFEFAAKLAGVSEEQVRLTLNLEKRFEDKPILRELLINGEVSVNKLVRIASIATAENQELLAEQVKLLPNRAIETLVRDVKYESGLHMHLNPSQKSKNASTDVAENLKDQFSNESSIRKLVFGSLNLSEEVIEKLLELQNKSIDVNQLILDFLEKRELEIIQEKEKLAAEAKQTESRYIPVEVQRILKKEFGTKCSITSCQKEHVAIHHSQRFSISQKHDPKYLAPMCKEHHLLAHSVDVKFHEKRLAFIRA